MNNYFHERIYIRVQCLSHRLHKCYSFMPKSSAQNNSWTQKVLALHFITDKNLVTTQQTKNICITFVQCRPNAPTLYKCYTNVLRLLGKTSRQTSCFWRENNGVTAYLMTIFLPLGFDVCSLSAYRWKREWSGPDGVTGTDNMVQKIWDAHPMLL